MAAETTTDRVLITGAAVAAVLFPVVGATWYLASTFPSERDVAASIQLAIHSLATETHVANEIERAVEPLARKADVDEQFVIVVERLLACMEESGNWALDRQRNPTLDIPFPQSCQETWRLGARRSIR